MRFGLVWACLASVSHHPQLNRRCPLSLSLTAQPIPNPPSLHSTLLSLSDPPPAAPRSSPLSPTHTKTRAL